jgi:hypothetical protein
MQRTDMNVIDKADRLMKEEKQDEAKALLVGLLQEHPNKKGYYEDAVNIYLYGNMYQEAKDIFRLYKERFNQELRSDFSLEAIEKEEKEFIEEAKLYQGSDVKVFKPIYPIFGRAIRGIKIYHDKIVIKHFFTEYSYAWSEISEALIKKCEGELVGGGKYVQKRLELKTPNKSFRFNVDNGMPDFKHSDILLQELKKHIEIREDKHTKRIKEIPWWIIVPISFSCIILLVTHKIDIWIPIVVLVTLMIVIAIYGKPR